jgi:hypothetical protein
MTAGADTDWHFMGRLLANREPCKNLCARLAALNPLHGNHALRPADIRPDGGSAWRVFYKVNLAENHG